MTTAAASGDIERFRTVVTRRLGLQFETDKRDFLAGVIARRTHKTRRNAGAYLAGLETEVAAVEWSALAQELTVGETYFFRNSEQFRAFVDVTLPDRMRARTADRSLRFLSAGCASGEEAYSLSILAHQHVAPSWQVAILGVDVNPAALAIAARGRYSRWSLRETPPDVQQQWFRMEGQEAVLQNSARAAVRFEQRNLLEDDAELWPRETYDAIFCRNVLMYFAPDRAQAVIALITGALAPGGYLFLGHAETLRGLSTDFDLHHTHGTFYYQRKEHIEPHAAIPSPPAASSMFAATRMVAVLDSADSWVEAIQRASARIHALAHASRQPGPAAPESEPIVQRQDSTLARALELLKSERFPEALDFLASLPFAIERDAPLLLLRAVLLTHTGQLRSAEHACQALLAIDATNAGAYYVLALCREGAGDRKGAVDQDLAAVRLDATFAMPRLHLGLLARRNGDPVTARRELGAALTLLASEQSSRVILFGGGFSRDALVALCHAEIAAVETARE